MRRSRLAFAPPSRAGGTAADAVVGSGGAQSVDGGSATSATVNSGGFQFVYSGGVSADAMLNGGGMEDVLAGGTASGTSVGSGGLETVVSGGTAAGGAISSAGDSIRFVGFGGGRSCGVCVAAGALDAAGAPAVPGRAAQRRLPLARRPPRPGREGPSRDGGRDGIAAGWTRFRRRLVAGRAEWRRRAAPVDRRRRHGPPPAGALLLAFEIDEVGPCRADQRERARVSMCR